MSDVAKPQIVETDNVDDCPADYAWFDAAIPACVKCPDGYAYDFKSQACFVIPQGPITTTPITPISTPAPWWDQIPFAARVIGGLGLVLVLAWGAHEVTAKR